MPQTRKGHLHNMQPVQKTWLEVLVRKGRQWRCQEMLQILHLSAKLMFVYELHLLEAVPTTREAEWCRI